MTYLATGFQAADQDTTGSLKACLSSIDANPFFRAVKEESYRYLGLAPLSRILEVGCGTGSDAWRLAGITGKSGLVIGIDTGLSMIQDASRRGMNSFPTFQDHPIPHFLRMDGRYLGFSDKVFDAVREDRALQHISDPELVVREMFRVLKPGGRFAIFEPDWELFIIDGFRKNLTRTILNFWADNFMNGWIGRGLVRICQDNGAREIAVHPRTLILRSITTCDEIFAIRDTAARAVSAGVISPADGDHWISYLETTDKEGRFFSSFTGYLVHGIK